MGYQTVAWTTTQGYTNMINKKIQNKDDYGLYRRSWKLKLSTVELNNLLIMSNQGSIWFYAKRTLVENLGNYLSSTDHWNCEKNYTCVRCSHFIIFIIMIMSLCVKWNIIFNQTTNFNWCIVYLFIPVVSYFWLKSCSPGTVNSAMQL